jgi:hypothetical protein
LEKVVQPIRRERLDMDVADFQPAGIGRALESQENLAIADLCRVEPDETCGCHGAIGCGLDAVPGLRYPSALPIRRLVQEPGVL